MIRIAILGSGLLLVHDSWLKVHDYDAGGKGFMVQGSWLKVHDYDAGGKVVGSVQRGGGVY